MNEIGLEALNLVIGVMLLMVDKKGVVFVPITRGQMGGGDPRTESGY